MFTERSNTMANLASSRFIELQSFCADHIWNKKEFLSLLFLPSPWFARSETLTEWLKYFKNATCPLRCGKSGKNFNCEGSILFFLGGGVENHKTTKCCTAFFNSYWFLWILLKWMEQGRRYSAELLTGLISPMWPFSKVLSGSTTKQQKNC